MAGQLVVQLIMTLVGFGCVKTQGLSLIFEALVKDHGFKALHSSSAPSTQ